MRTENNRLIIGFSPFAEIAKMAEILKIYEATFCRRVVNKRSGESFTNVIARPFVLHYARKIF